MVLNLITLTAQTIQPTTTTKLNTVESAVGNNNPMTLLQKITDRFGPRLTGSSGEHTAAEWALQKMRELQLDHVHTESWTLKQGWTRKHATARLLNPYNFELSIAAYGWSGSTEGNVSGDIVVVDDNTPAEMIDANSWAGKVVLVNPTSPDTIRVFSQLPALAKIGAESHALAIVNGIDKPGTFLLHAGPVGFPGQHSSIPILDMPREQRLLLMRLVHEGVKPRVTINIANQFTDAPVQENNVVGQLTGALHPNQVILLGAHLDSWDLSAGATDDGAGVAVLLSVANALRSSGVRTDRTIRFVLFTGEEQGLLGSQAYVQRHKAELPNIVCALVLDWGAGPITNFPLAGHPEMKRPLDSLVAAVTGLKGITTSLGFLTFTDAFSFTLAGVPGIAPFQDSPKYSEEGHSPADTLDKVKASALQFNTKVLALSAVWLADVPRRPGLVFSSSETQLSLSPLRRTLQLLGLWGFRN